MDKTTEIEILLKHIRQLEGVVNFTEAQLYDIPGENLTDVESRILRKVEEYSIVRVRYQLNG